MSKIKVSQMTEASSVSQGDKLMVVQNGENKKVDVSIFQQAGQPAGNASQLEGHGASYFLPATGTAADSSKLGGVASSNYATKDYVDARTGQSSLDPTWCCPKMWFDAETLPNNDSEHYHYCDGSFLDPDEYPELFAVIGYKYTPTSLQSSGFKLPDLNGRFVLGANTGIVKKTVNLPTGLYSGDDFDENGQFIFPSDTGKSGGDAVTVQYLNSQMSKHTHVYEKPEIGTKGEAHSSAEYRVKGSETTDTSYTAGYNDASMVAYPATAQSVGMLSMPPYITFAWIMQVKPFETEIEE